MTADDDEVPGAVAGQPEAGATPPADGEPSPEEQVDQDAEEELEPLEEMLEEEPAAGAPEPVVGFQPPEGGEAFGFRVDGRDVAVPGALRWDHGIYIPTEAWTTVQRHLADRDAFSRELDQRDQRIADLNPETHPVVIENRESLKALSALLDKGPVEVAKWLDNFAMNRPLLEAQIANAALKAQLEARTQRVDSFEQEQGAQALSQQLPGYLRQNIEFAVGSDPRFKDLAGKTDKLLESLWPFAAQLFYEAEIDNPPGFPGLKRGQIVVQPQLLQTLLTREVERQAEVTRLEAATRFNRDATGKFRAAPTVSTRGRPIPGARTPTYTPGDPRSIQQFKDDFMSGADEE